MKQYKNDIVETIKSTLTSPKFKLLSMEHESIDYVGFFRSCKLKKKRKNTDLIKVSFKSDSTDYINNIKKYYGNIYPIEPGEVYSFYYSTLSIQFADKQKPKITLYTYGTPKFTLLENKASLMDIIKSYLGIKKCIKNTHIISPDQIIACIYIGKDKIDLNLSEYNLLAKEIIDLTMERNNDEFEEYITYINDYIK